MDADAAFWFAGFSSVPDGFKAKLLLAPIKLGTLVEIKGRAAGSPKGYRGNSIGAKAIQLEIDGVSRQAVASIDVSLFGQASVNCLATLSENAIDFAVDISLPPPLGTTRFIGALTHQSVALAADFRTEIGVDAEWGFGRMKIAKAAQVEGKIKLVAGPTGAVGGKGACDVRVSLGPVSLAFGLSFDPGRIDKLPQMIRDEVIKRVVDALKQVTVWLEAVLDGTIEFVIDVSNTAEWIAENVRDEVRRSWHRYKPEITIRW